MKTIITQEVNKKTVIIGFSDPSIDRFETEKIVKPLIESSQEMVDVANFARQVDGRNQIVVNAKANLKNPEIQKDPKLVSKNQKAIQDADIFIQAKNQEIIPLAGKIKIDKISLMQSQAVFHAPKAGEYMIEEGPDLDIFTGLFAEIAGDKTKKLGCDIVDGKVYAPEILPDYRGKTFFEKVGDAWVENNVSELGLDKKESEILQDDLTIEQSGEIAEQNETERIDKLTADEKTVEFNGRIGGVLGQAATVRSELEIKGVDSADALTQSQDFYKSEVEKLNIIYGV